MNHSEPQGSPNKNGRPFFLDCPRFKYDVCRYFCLILFNIQEQWTWWIVGLPPLPKIWEALVAPSSPNLQVERSKLAGGIELSRISMTFSMRSLPIASPSQIASKMQMYSKEENCRMLSTTEEWVGEKYQSEEGRLLLFLRAETDLECQILCLYPILSVFLWAASNLLKIIITAYAPTNTWTPSRERCKKHQAITFPSKRTRSTV